MNSCKSTEIEKTEGEIKVLQAKLELLKEMEKHKTPCEEAYKRVYGKYPITGIAYGSSWSAFQDGYNASQEDYKVGEYQPTPQDPEKEQKWDVVHESVKWCEAHPGENPLDWVKPQTPEETAEGLKKAFQEAVKQGVVPSFTKRQNLYDLIVDCMVKYTSTVQPGLIYGILDAVEEWLPKEQSAAGSQNVYVECSVEGFNDAIKKIKSKLR